MRHGKGNKAAHFFLSLESCEWLRLSTIYVSTFLKKTARIFCLFTHVQHMITVDLEEEVNDSDVLLESIVGVLLVRLVQTYTQT